MLTLVLMSLTRSGIHLDGSSFRLSSSRNQSDDDSADPPKPYKLLLTLLSLIRFVLSHHLHRQKFPQDAAKLRQLF